MNYQICKSCGLGSLPTAQSCTRCGLSFSESANASINQGDPPKTVVILGGQTNYAATPPPKNNSKIYWILGGLGGLILVGGLFVVVVAVGIYFYSANKNVTKVENTDKTRTPYPINSRPTPSDKSTQSDNTDTVFGDEELAAVFSVKKQVGKFTHYTTLQPADSPEKKLFQNSGGEATAMYGVKGKNENVIYSIASYSSREKAQAEFKNYIDREKQKGAQMIAEIIMDQQNKSVNASYKLGATTVLTFCSWKLDNITLCHRIGSPQGATVINFYNSWFNIK